jgi:gliding motility-associated transport system permease protein
MTTLYLKQIYLVFKREFKALLTTPLFYVLTGIFFTLSAMFYLVMLFEFAKGSGEALTVNVTDSVIRPTFHSIHFFLLIQIPLLTMRTFSEDNGSGMLDLLQTTPVRDWSLLTGKFLATSLGMLLYIGATTSFSLVTANYAIIEWPVMIGSLAALVLASCGYVAVGLFYSSVTESQVVSAVLTYVTLFILAFGSIFATGWQILPLQQALRHFTIMEHISAILDGNVAPMNLVYFLALTVLFLFFTARSLEARRWNA